MKVHHINCGTLRPPARAWIDGVGSLWERGTLICHVLLLEGPDGLVLVDTGVGIEDCEEPRERLGSMFLTLAAPALRPEETALRQVERLGFSARDVRHI